MVLLLGLNKVGFWYFDEKKFSGAFPQEMNPGPKGIRALNGVNECPLRIRNKPVLSFN